MAEEYYLHRVRFTRGVVTFLDILGTKGVHEEAHLQDEVRVRRNLILGLNAGLMGRTIAQLIGLFRAFESGGPGAQLAGGEWRAMSLHSPIASFSRPSEVSGRRD